MSTELDLAHYRKVAEAATPGPWLQPIEEEPRLISDPSGGMSLLGLSVDDEAIVSELEDATFIATFNPQVVLRFIAALEALAPPPERWVVQSRDRDGDDKWETDTDPMSEAEAQQRAAQWNIGSNSHRFRAYLLPEAP